MTKEEARRYHYNKHVHSECTSLYEIYGKPSYEKLKEERRCRDIAYENHGYDIRLHYLGCHFFGFSYLYDEVNPETGEVKVYLVYKTGRNTYIHEVTDLVF